MTIPSKVDLRNSRVKFRTIVTETAWQAHDTGESATKEYNTEENQLLWAQWNPLTDMWTFRGRGVGAKPEKVFKSLAQKAASGFPHPQSIPKSDRWKVWLDTLRNENRNFDEEPCSSSLEPTRVGQVFSSSRKGSG
jgi:hypothetical protein